MPTVQADEAVVTLLEAITSPVSLDAGRNLFSGPMVGPSATVPAPCVHVLATGGDLNVRMLGPASDLRRVTVQVMVRADRSDYARGLSLARACLEALHCPTIPSGWTDIQVREPEPTYVGIQAEGRHAWSLNVALIRST